MIALKSALPEALAIQRTRGFMHSPLWEDWSLFTAVAAERLQYVEEFRTTYVSTRECSNYDCNVIVAEKAALRRCVECRAHYYCSPQCQRLAWKEQEHRTRCASLRAEPVDCHTDERNNRFYRFVLLRSYQKHKPALFLRKLAHIHRTGNTDFCVVTEYVRGKFAPRVAPLTEWTHLLDEAQCIEWGATNRKEVHVVRGGLLRIAKQIPPGVDVVGQLAEFYPELFQQVQELASMNVAETYWHR
ncbi:hypothetical protein B0H14DRAFT_2858579 [Mycena olivaceomarginata]|nr:hypothetical protein B0H14DRAFT_2858579 [Mycena olivaceomarginata]